MSQKKTHSRIKINCLLVEAGWHFVDDDNDDADIILEQNVEQTGNRYSLREAETTTLLKGDKIVLHFIRSITPI